MQPHDILGVALDADPETIKRAYFELAKAMHPDAGGSDKDFVRLHAAYEAMVGGWKPATTTRHREPGEEPKSEERKSAQRKRNQWKREDRNRGEWKREERTREDNQKQPFVASTIETVANPVKQAVSCGLVNSWIRCYRLT